MHFDRLFLVIGILCPAGFLSAADENSRPASGTIEFNRDIRPILSDTCYTCHGPDAAKRASDLRLDTEKGAFAELGGFRAIVPGNLKDSDLWQRVNSADPNERMPPPKSGRQLTPRQVELLGRWIEQGAKWQKHWSFIPPRRPALPAVKNAGWPRNGIDSFILARLEREGLQPSPEASKETLIRRVTLDLTGLPPTLAEIDAFLADSSPDAYEKVVDRLLASPRYGERMVLEWLDAARYADSNGYQTDGTRPMWPWRDGVIDALNRNMPFDQFTIEQIAGDLLPNPALSQKIATGFHRNHMLNGEGGRIAEESRVDYVVDRVETTSTVWLGLTLGCARCHDHKYDPFSQREFYQLFAYYNNVTETGGVDRRSSTAAPILELPTDAQKTKLAELNKAVADLDQQLKANAEKLLAAQAEWEQSLVPEKLPANIAAVLKVEAAKRTAGQTKELTDYYFANSPERQPLQKQFDDAKKSRDGVNNSILVTMVMEERPQPRDTFILIRGEYDKPRDKVTASVPATLSPLPDGVPNNRLGFAKWLVDPDNPLTARVTVNRAWQLVFGTGLVKTPEDFGSQGDSPSHPDLLDWLATEFTGGDRQWSVVSSQLPESQNSNPKSEIPNPKSPPWDVKALHRLLVTSATYRQSSRATPALIDKDPENRMLARGPRFRLNSHTIRDQALAVSGLLVDKIGGPPVRPYQPAGVWEDLSFGKIVYQQDKGESLYRRSLYTFWRRSVGPTMMFDTPARQVCTVRQPRTNTPLHALTLLNDVTYVEAARVFAERLLKHPAATAEERLVRAFRTVTARTPTAGERQVLLSAYERVLSQYQSDPTAALKLITAGEAPRDATLDPAQHAAWTGIASVLLNLDEAINKE